MRAKVLTCLLAGAIVLAACGGDDDDGGGGGGGDEALKIGFMQDTGLGGIGDIPANAGAAFRVEQFNDAGGACGKPIEYEAKQVADDDPAAAQRATAELIDGGADVILGPPFSTMGLPMLEETNGELPIIFVTSTEVSLADAANGSFLASFNDKVQASAAAEFATKKGLTNAVTLSSADIPYLNVTTAAFAEVFTGAGGVVVRDLSFSLGATDFSSQVNEIADIEPAVDVIYSAFFLPEAGVFLEQLRAAGVEATVISADGFDASQIYTAGDVAEGVFYTAHAFPNETNGVQAFLDAYNESGGEDIPTPSFGSLGAEAVEVAVAAFEAADCSTDGKGLIEAISAIDSLETTTGTVSYAGTNGTPKRDVVIMTVEGGAPVVADSFFPATVAG